MAGGMFGEFLVFSTVSRFSTSHAVVAAIAWSLVWSYGLYDTIRLVFLMVFRDFLFVGVILATLLW